MDFFPLRSADDSIAPQFSGNTFFTYLRGRRSASHIAYSIPHAVYTSHPLSFTDPPPTGYYPVNILLPDICRMYILPVSAASIITDLLWLRHCTSFAFCIHIIRKVILNRCTADTHRDITCSFPNFSFPFIRHGGTTFGLIDSY